MIGSFILIEKASLATSKTLLQRSLDCLNFNLDVEVTVSTNERSDLYELWQRHKKLKTMLTRLDLIFTIKDIHTNST